jgi:light-dependent protochlorophyllide reductase
VTVDSRTFQKCGRRKFNIIASALRSAKIFLFCVLIVIGRRDDKRRYVVTPPSGAVECFASHSLVGENDLFTMMTKSSPPPIYLSVVLLLFLVASSIDRAFALTIAITGSSQGIGLDAATRLIADGHTVIHACRSEERAQVAVRDSGGGVPMVCDLASLDSIRDFSRKLQAEQSTLDVLCLNAGIAPSTKAEKPNLTVDGFEECIGTNHLGHFLLSNLLKDTLASSQTTGGRLVVMASSVHDPEAPGGAVGGKDGATLGDLSGLGINLLENTNGPTMADGSVEYNGSKVYKDSKLCNVLFCREALKRFDTISSIRSLNPGFIPSSGLFRAPRKDNWFGATAFTFVAGLVGFAVPITVGGERLAYMATAGDEEVPTGSYFSAEVGSKAATRADGFDNDDVSKEASNDKLAAKLWDRSLEILGM